LTSRAPWCPRSSGARGRAGRHRRHRLLEAVCPWVHLGRAGGQHSRDRGEATVAVEVLLHEAPEGNVGSCGIASTSPSAVVPAISRKTKRRVSCAGVPILAVDLCSLPIALLLSPPRYWNGFFGLPSSLPLLALSAAKSSARFVVDVGPLAHRCRRRSRSSSA
jgi:hypothetical protein